MVKRLNEAEISSSKKSILLLGPRQTGKSTVLGSFKSDLTINLAREATFLEFSSQPDLLEKMLKDKKVSTVFIDEVQRLPSLLNTIQAIIDENPKKVKFYLSGSSARKLRRGQANLLPGRILAFYMTPFVSTELGVDFDLDTALKYGTLPGVLAEKTSRHKELLLKSYSSTYLKEEIQTEALTKNIEGFSRFLFVAASKSGEFLDFAKLGSLASISQKTSSRFFEILQDTLIVDRVNSFSKSETRRLVQHPKFYFFDTGVLNSLLGNFTVSADRIGFLFEHLMINQIMNYAKLTSSTARFSTYRTEAGSEVDLVVENESRILALEIKSSKKLVSKDFSGLRSFEEFYSKKCRKILLYRGEREYKEGSIDVLPWKKALAEVYKFI